MHVSSLIEEVIHTRRLLANSRDKAEIWRKKANKMAQKVELLSNPADSPTASIEPDHPLVGTISQIEDFLYKNAQFMEEGEYRKVMTRMNELTTQLLSFKRKQQPVEPELN